MKGIRLATEDAKNEKYSTMGPSLEGRTQPVKR